ncbi:MAG: HXXEE domain-containing protein [Muribaculaceae bacterium]
MSNLHILYPAISLPLAFILHDGEEVLMFRHWMTAHKDSMTEKFPKLKPIITHLSSLTTAAFAIAALEELIILAIATYYVVICGDYSLYLWSALFIAFSFHLLIHICQAIVVRGYVPGLITSLLLIPYAFLVLYFIWHSMDPVIIALCGAAGIAFIAANLAFAHWIGRFLTKQKNDTKE